MYMYVTQINELLVVTEMQLCVVHTEAASRMQMAVVRACHAVKLRCAPSGGTAADSAVSSSASLFRKVGNISKTLQRLVRVATWTWLTGKEKTMGNKSLYNSSPILEVSHRPLSKLTNMCGVDDVCIYCCNLQ